MYGKINERKKKKTNLYVEFRRVYKYVALTC